MLGGKKCGHGLTSGPRETASEPFLNELLGLFQYPPGSGRALLAGTLLLRCCAARFACRTSTWRLPDSGHVAGLIAAVVGAVGEAVVGCAAHEVSWVSDSGPGRKRIRLNRKTPAHLVASLVHVFGRGCVMWCIPVFLFLIPRGGVVIRMMRDVILLRSGLEEGNSLGLCADPRLQACMIV